MQNTTTTIEHVTKQEVLLSDLFFIFLKIGSLAFGGYMALISVIENIIVKKLKLISHEDMLDGISLANLLPGPMAVNVVAYIGYKVRGGMGAIVVTIAVLLPAFLLILALSYIYFDFNEVINFKPVFMGFIPAVAAIVFSVVWRLGKKTILGKTEALIAIASILVLFFIPHDYRIYTPIAIIVISGISGYFLFNNNKDGSNNINNKLSIKKYFNHFTCLYFLPCAVVYSITYR